MPQIIELSWDERSEDHIARHGVTPEEVEEAVLNYREFRRRANLYISIGQTDAGRYLTVVLQQGPHGYWHVVTARPSDIRERRRVRRRNNPRS